MQKREKIVVTGGYGLVGHAIQEIMKSNNTNEANNINNEKKEFIFLSSKDFDLTSIEETKKMFETLADKKINIQVISTSEIKISVLIDDAYTELAVRALHTAYGLDQEAAKL